MILSVPLSRHLAVHVVNNFGLLESRTKTFVRLASFVFFCLWWRDINTCFVFLVCLQFPFDFIYVGRTCKPGTYILVIISYCYFYISLHLKKGDSVRIRYIGFFFLFCLWWRDINTCFIFLVSLQFPFDFIDVGRTCKPGTYVCMQMVTI
jgi:hypothetical protein